MTMRAAIAPGIRFLLATVSAIGLATTCPEAGSATPGTTGIGTTDAVRPSLTFAENRGQWPDAIHYAASVPGALIELGPTGATYVISRRTPTESQTDSNLATSANAKPPTLESIALRASFPGSRTTAMLVPEQPAANLSHYYLGSDPGAWRTNVPNYGAVRYDDLYAGIDLVYHGADDQLEYDFEIEPGADYRDIRVRYDGIERLDVSSNGDLAITTRFGKVIERAPVAWQVIDGEKRPVRAGYRRMSKNTFGFEVLDSLDPTAPLVIDPILHYSTYLGGSSYDELHAVDYNPAGEAWVVGGTLSPDFPATGTPVPSIHYSVCITRLATNGQSTLWSVFLGGSEDQIGYTLDVDLNDHAFLAGVTGSNDFPTTAGCYDASFNGTNPGEIDMFVARLSPTGTLLYSTFLGGPDSDNNAGLGLNAAGQVYVLGDAGNNYPTTIGCYDATWNGGGDVVLSILNLAGLGPADLVYSTYLGGSANEESHGLDIDVVGNAWIAGATISSDFPSTSGPPFNTTYDAFLAQIVPAGNSTADLSYCQKYGGSGHDYGVAVASDFIGVALAGVTTSTNFPVSSGAYQATYGGGSNDGFVMLHLPNLSFTFYSTYLGGANLDAPSKLHLNPAGQATVCGYTGSSTFPSTAGSYDPTWNGGFDMFLTKFDIAGALMEGTFIGGSSDDVAYDFREDLLGRRYLTGTTNSADFPTTTGAFDTSINGGPIDGVVLKFQAPHPESCAACVSPPDTCCAKAPRFLGAASPPSLSPNILVGTRNESQASPYAVTVFDLGSPAPTEDVEWTTISRYNGPNNSWKADSLGTVFGVTVDDYGNIFVTHSSCYDGDAVGTIAGAGPGAVYRIDASTGVMKTFCRLPNYPDANVIAGENLPGLGNISYDCRHKQFFVTNLEDGRIYRIKANGVNGLTGTIQQVFDPFVADTGPTNYLTPIGSVPSPGWAPLGERLWGVQWHMDRVYYGVWREDIGAPSPTLHNEVRSVALNASGAFVTSSDQHELFLPAMPLVDYSMPVSDISFRADGRMLLGERGIDSNTFTSPHMARNLEYLCEAGCWTSANLYQLGVCCIGANAAGGVDYDNFAYTGGPIGRVWGSAEALHLGYASGAEIFGYQGSRPTGGSNVTGIIIDDDGNNQILDKTTLGDVEAPGCINTDTGQLCGKKFQDNNRDGVQNNGEPALLGWPIVLNGPGGPYQAFTDEQGNYCFDDLPAGLYTITETNFPGWIQTAPPGGSYVVSVSTGQMLGGFVFGNYSCYTAPQCIAAPPGLAAWFTFDEGAGTTLANDNAHLDPARNALHLSGGATFSTDGKVGNALQLFGPGAVASTPPVEQLDLDFGTGSFALDAWLNPASSAQSPRVVAEKRLLVSASPYRTRGWSLYLNGQQLMLEIGTSEITETFPGPTIPADTWTFVAVSVDRVANSGAWSINGAPVPAFNFSPPGGSLFNNADLLVGGRPGAPSWNGLIDELQFFGTPLSTQSIAAVAAAPAGKCREHCRVPAVTSICKDKPTVTICMNIVNQTNAPQSYHWSVAGLPSGPGCTVAGPVTFSPSSGTITVPAGGISSPICITMTRPAGLINQNDTACYEFSFVNDATGVCRSCVGKIRADNTCWCVTPAQPGVVSVGQRFAPGIIGQPIGIGIKHPCDPIAVLDYRVSAVYEPGAHPDPLAVSLNGLPPGEPVFGSLSLDTEGEAEVTVMATYPRAYDPAGLYQVVMEADTDGDGIMEIVSCTPIASTYEADDVSAVPDPTAPPVPLVNLKALPNPFQTTATLSFTLPTAGPVDLAVYDLSGRLIRRIHAGSVAAGPSSFLWDGRDEAGRETGGGIFFVRLLAGGSRLQTKLVKVR